MYEFKIFEKITEFLRMMYIILIELFHEILFHFFYVLYATNEFKYILSYYLILNFSFLCKIVTS